MSTFGLDYVTGPPITAMQAAGVGFVCRYLSEVNPQTQMKLLTPEEAKTLSAAGIALVSNYEWYAERPLEGFASGVADAKIAESQHAACGGPANRPIYFSVDIDVDGSQVADYFKGVASVIGLSRTGAYGSFRVLHALFNDGLITWGWQTYAWSGGAWEPRAQLQQYQNGVVMAGHSVDYDRAMTSDYGQWKIGGNMIPGWTDDGVTLRDPGGGEAALGFRAKILEMYAAGQYAANDWIKGKQYYLQRLEASNPDLGDGDQLMTHFHMFAYPHNPQGAVAHLKGQVVVEYIGDELLYTRQQYANIYAAYQQLKSQPAAPGIDPAKVAARFQALDALFKQGEQLVSSPL